MQLSTRGISLARYVLSFTDEKVVGPGGQEMNATRRLNGEDSSQRRHFFKNTEEFLRDADEQIKSAQKEYNARLAEIKSPIQAQNPKAKDESTEDYNDRIVSITKLDKALAEELSRIWTEMNEKIDEARQAMCEVETTEKVEALLKKCFLEYGDKAVFSSGEDAGAEEICVALGL